MYLSVFSPNEGKYGPEKLQNGHFSRSDFLSFQIEIYVFSRSLKLLSNFRRSKFSK